MVERATDVEHPRDRARHLPEAGRPGREPRPGRRGPARAAARRQDLRGREGRAGARSTSSSRTTSRRCASSRCARWPRASGARRSGRAASRRSSSARRASASWSASRRARRAPPRCCGAARASPGGSTRTGTWSTSRRPREAPDRIDAAAQRQLHKHIEKARELGAEVVRLHGRDPVTTLLDFARSHAVGHIADRALARARSGARLAGRDFMERMVREADDFDLLHRRLAATRRASREGAHAAAAGGAPLASRWRSSLGSSRCARSRSSSARRRAILAQNYRSVLAAQRMKEALERIDDDALLRRHRSSASTAPPAIAERHVATFEWELRVEEGNITEPGEAELVRGAARRSGTSTGAARGLPRRARRGRRGDCYFRELRPRFRRCARSRGAHARAQPGRDGAQERARPP